MIPCIMTKMAYALAELKFVLVEGMVQYVTMDGMIKMQVLSADKWDSHPMVYNNSIIVVDDYM